MIRNFKALGLSLVAMLAVGGVMASAAMAESFHSSVEPTVVTAHSESPQVFVATATVSCETGTFMGTASDATQEELTIWPQYTECESSIDPDIEVDTEGCDYVFHAEKASGANHKRVDVECEPEHHIIITSDACNIYIGTQTDIGQGVTYTNINNKTEVTVSATATSIDITKKQGPLCFLVGNTGTYTGKAIVKGYVDNGSTGNITDGTTAFNEGAQAAIWWE